MVAIFADLTMLDVVCTMENTWLVRVGKQLQSASVIGPDIHKTFTRSLSELYMMTSSHGNIFRVTDLCEGNSPVNSPHKGQWGGALVFSLIYVWANGWVNNRDAGELRRHWAYYAITLCLFVWFITKSFLTYSFFPPIPALSTISRPLTSSMCSITPETANVGSSYNRMRGPGIGCWF